LGKRVRERGTLTVGATVDAVMVTLVAELVGVTGFTEKVQGTPAGALVHVKVTGRLNHPDCPHSRCRLQLALA